MMASDNVGPPTSRREVVRSPSRQDRQAESIQLRSATLILPRTGERVKRVVTLREPDREETARNVGEPEEMGPESPLLATHRRRRRNSSRLGRRKVIKYQAGLWVRKSWEFATSKTGKGVLKCSLAYLLGSMATFIPVLSRYLGHQDGKHMVATCTVYFHPARSQGSMFEAVFMAVLAFGYAAFISFTSMGVTVLFHKKLDLIVVGHIVVLILFCGGGLGFVGWVKQRMANPLVNVACSLTSLAIITVLTKEGAVQAAAFSPDKVLQVMKMVSMGVVATTAVCFLIAPVSARKELRQNMIELTDSFGDMLAMITRGFLTGSEMELDQRGFQEASNRYKTVYASLSKNTKESKWEHYALGTEAEHRLEIKLVNCLQRLAQNIGGLRSAATTQFSLMAQSTTYGGPTPATSVYTPTTAPLTGGMSRVDSWMSFQENFPVLEAISERSEDDETEASRSHDLSEDQSGLPTARSSTEIFERFIMHLGPSMKSLAFTLKQILDELPYGPAPEFKIAVNPHFRSSLVEAIDLYSNARKEALSSLYKAKDLSVSRATALEADFEEVAASCGYFSFSLQDFAEEMKIYLDILDELKDEVDKPFFQKRSWNWLKFWRRKSRKNNSPKDETDPEHDNLITRNEDVDIQQEVPSPVDRDQDTIPRPEKPNPKPTVTYRIWKASRFFRRDDIKYAIKVGAGAAIYALPSFLMGTRPLYAHWRGEWGLLSYMLVCSMTIGASNTTGLSRALGTCIGAICAMIAWVASQGNVFAMAFFGWIMSLATFYIIVGMGRGPLGRFILLTYNLSALYAYSLSVKDEKNDEDEGGTTPNIGEIALHRVVAVLSGCLWGLVVTRLIWPISARNRFRDGLSLLLLRMGLIWKRDPLATLLEGESKNSYMNLREELQLQKYLSRLESLRGSASYEFELRGPFPGAEYGIVLKSIGSMLDAFHAMNVVIMKDLQATQGEAEILRHTISERGQLCSRISHLFQGIQTLLFVATFLTEYQVMASSFKLEFPLNDALPNTDHARDRLLAKVFKYRKAKYKPNGSSDEDYAMIYAYGMCGTNLSSFVYRD